ncbi:acyl-CoA dehydrogenase [Micromonospora sp. CPCC 205539]|uniref:acyl-CoA dehydrogenase family protein n=1 Tax=Micromonospora sp. CPCC 205539 TaxID=3122408 RepID=UPI002FEFA131
MTAASATATATELYPAVNLLAARLRDDVSFSPATCADLDRSEAFPAAAVALLDRLGVPAHYVPQRLGGAWRDHDELVHLVRQLAGRDLTVAVAHAKTFLGAVSVWLANDAGQCGRLATDVLAGVPVAWGLTEPGCGSDLWATGMAAEPVPDGYRLTGVKQPVNNATRGALMCVLARTGTGRGPRDLSLLLLDKRRLAPGSYACLPKALTHGIRGADISGLALTAATVGHDALVGAPGDGLEIVLRALQLTRVACAGLSLGAADHALRLVLEYARDRVLYERRLLDLPHVRRTLGGLCARALLVECTTLLAARSAHTLSGELSLVSAVAKAFVPTVVDELVAGAAELLGARAFLTDVYAHGAFAKLERDHRVVAIFDGNTAVNRQAVLNQLPALARGWSGRNADHDAVRRAAMLGTPLPPIGALSQRSRAGCSVVQALPTAVTELPAALRPLGAALLTATERVQAEIDAHPTLARDVPAESFELVERYEWCFAGAAAVHLWLANHERRREAWWHEAAWLRGALALVLERLDAPAPGAGQALDELARLLAATGAASVLPVMDLGGEPS